MATDVINSEIVQAFSKLPLHDAILHELQYEWEKKTLTMFISAFVKPKENAVPRQILWQDVSEIIIPHQNPWGPSVFINTKSVDNSGIFIIEMQSGDEIRIRAKTFEFIEPTT
jgi:hypothetical protein